MRSRALTYAPLAVFGVVYSLSCLIGAVLLLVEYRPFVALFEYFSGTDAPQLSSAEVRTNLLLLVVAPLVLAAGYVLGVHLLSAPLARIQGSREPVREPLWLPLSVFAILATIGLASLLRTGAIGRGMSWTDYGALVQARADVYSQLRFFEFVNLYILIPTAAAWIAVSDTGATRSRKLVRWAPAGITVALSFFLFSRKVVLTVLLITFFAWVLNAARQRFPYLWHVLGAGLVSMVVLYCVLVVAPVYSEASTTAREAAAHSAVPTDSEREARATKVAETFGLESRTRAIVLYAALSPLTRSSAPSLYYPVIFPQLHDYYGLDVGQDVLGIGAMPDDNLIVWDHLNPDVPGGATSVSYQFALYSQIGTLGSILVSLIVGFLLAGVWLLSQGTRSISPILGALVLLLAVYLAVDSLRNSLIVSYGVIWGFVFIGALAALQHLVSSALAHRGRSNAVATGASARP